MTFLDMAQDLMANAEAKAAFDADPDAFLAARGFEGLSVADVADAVGFVADTLPADAARQLTGPEADGEALARVARLDPGDLEAANLEAGHGPGSESGLLEIDPSGELDLTDDPDADPVATHHTGTPDAGPDEDGFWRPEEQAQEPGFGVGWEPSDADDVTAASPEFANILDHPADVDLDLSHVPELAVDATDPISEAIAWADREETAAQHAEAVEHDAGHELHHDDADHHHDADHDGHLDI